MDTDLEQMSHEQLIEEVKKLRQGIRQHRDSKGMASLHCAYSCTHWLGNP
jgi:hypothetical protein